LSEIKFGIEFLPTKKVSKLVDYSKLAEEAGVDYIWVTDHYNNRNVYASLSAIAYATNKVLIGTGVTNPYVINPCWTASAIATIDEISGGRSILGIGAGDKITLESIGIPWTKPLTSVREAVEIIRSLLDGETVKYEGKIFKIKGARLNFKVKRRIPIYIGAQAPKMLRLSGYMGDGVLINASHPVDFEYASKHIKEGLEERTEKPDFFDIVAYTAMSIDNDISKAIEAVKIVVAFIVGGSSPMILQRHDIDENKAEIIRNTIAKGDFGGAMQLVDDNMIEAFSVVGTPKDIINKVEELRKMGVTQVVAGSPIGPKVKDAIKLYGEVIEAFK
jgi:5,10-methylenetetrahydromethanopterin reductase